MGFSILGQVQLHHPQQQSNSLRVKVEEPESNSEVNYFLCFFPGKHHQPGTGRYWLKFQATIQDSNRHYFSIHYLAVSLNSIKTVKWVFWESTTWSIGSQSHTQWPLTSLPFHYLLSSSFQLDLFLTNMSLRYHLTTYLRSYCL